MNFAKRSDLWTVVFIITGVGFLYFVIFGIIIAISLMDSNSGTFTRTSYTYEKSEPKVQKYGHAYFLCGWKNCDKSYHSELQTLKNTLNKLYPDVIFTVEQYSWRCGDEIADNASLNEMKTAYLQADRHTTEDAYGLAQAILNLPEAERNNTVLFGHSLGAKVVLKAMALLSNKNVHIRRAVLFGAAISVSDGDIDSALKISYDPVISLIHPQDGALMTASYTMETPQLGLGSCYARSNLDEILIENYQAGSIFDIASSESREEYKNNHRLSLFLSKWNDLCNSNFTNRINHIIIPQDKPNIVSTVIDAEFWWSNKDLFYDHNNNLWKLQQHSVTNHCRIVQVTNPSSTDSKSYRWANGRYEYMKPSFDRVRQQMAL